MKNRIVALGFVLAAATIAPAAQDLISTAKDQYNAAAYEDALATLARVEQAPPDVARQVEQYRVFCLFALGRTAEAETAAEAFVRKQPLARLDDAPPRIEAMFLAVRKRLLPSLIRAEYRAAKSALDEKNFPKGEPHLIQARELLAAARDAGAWDEGLDDLSLLIDGFIELGRGATGPVPDKSPGPPAAPAAAALAPAAPAAAAPAPAAPAAAARAPAAPAAAAPAPAAPAAAAVEVDSRPRVVSPPIYTTGDDGVVAPVVIDQKLPVVPAAIWSIMRAAPPTGLVVVVIDETGAVESAVIRKPVHPFYDRLLLSACREWKYSPATKDGVPVKFQKVIVVRVTGA